MGKRFHILSALLCLVTLLTVGVLYMRGVFGLVQQMPPQSLQLVKKGLSKIKKNRQKSAQTGARELHKQINTLKNFFRTNQQEKTTDSP